ncbi:6-phosphogluconate dehydrogenase [Mycena rosella]|uniref:phosphogluconate dehydrogenase (NADP(+)-dependent, decarboxylating) n=1 Tax=Mycena rosella TaxID=1033263 RepID=A0AAD7DTL3_MYCRO|nr:6-phosphogluconate dehydrogenase [Mycena rosella]
MNHLKGINVVPYNRNTSRVDQFLATDAKGTRIRGAHSPFEFVSQLKTPRLIFLVLMAGSTADVFISLLADWLDAGDVIVDLANSHYLYTARRLLFVGCGVGGARNDAFALTGSCIMPGGLPDAWPAVQGVLQRAAVQAGGRAATGYMELLAEACDLLRRVLNLSEDEIAEVFGRWNTGMLKSAVLLDMTGDILQFADSEDGEFVITKILDKARQKGAGSAAAVSVSIITQAVFSRRLSQFKAERTRASQLFSGSETVLFNGDKQAFIDDLEQTIYASKISSYVQAFSLKAAADKMTKWNFKYRSIAHIWRAGSLIADILTHIVGAYKRGPELQFLLFDDFFRQVSQAVLRGVSAPAFAFFDGYRSAVLPANLIQAQRYYFGAHGAASSPSGFEEIVSRATL